MQATKRSTSPAVDGTQHAQEMYISMRAMSGHAFCRGSQRLSSGPVEEAGQEFEGQHRSHGKASACMQEKVDGAIPVCLLAARSASEPPKR